MIKRILYFIINFPALVLLASAFTVRIYFIDVFKNAATTSFFWKWPEWSTLYKQFKYKN